MLESTTTLAKKIETTPRTWHRRVICRACTRLCLACVPVSIFLARVVVQYKASQRPLHKSVRMICSRALQTSGQRQFSMHLQRAGQEILGEDGPVVYPANAHHSRQRGDQVNLGISLEKSQITFILLVRTLTVSLFPELNISLIGVWGWL